MAQSRPSIAQSRKNQLMQLSASLFKTNGYHATTMRMLAEHMGMEAASLYNHISSKADLLETICRSVATDFTDQLQQVEQGQHTPAGQLEAILRFHLHMLLTRHDDVYVSNRDWKHLPEPALTQFLQQRRQYENRLAQIIQQGIDAGQFRAVHPHVAVMSLLAAVRSVEHWQRHKRGISSRQVTEDLITLLLQGLNTTS